MSRWFVYKRLYYKKSFFELLFGVFFTCFRERKSDQETVNNDFDMKNLWVDVAKIACDIEPATIKTERSQPLPTGLVNKIFAESILKIGAKGKERPKPKRNTFLKKLETIDFLSKSHNHLQLRQDSIRSGSSSKGSPPKASPVGKWGFINEIFSPRRLPMAMNKIVPSQFTKPALPMAAIPEILHGKFFSLTTKRMGDELSRHGF